MDFDFNFDQMLFVEVFGKWLFVNCEIVVDDCLLFYFDGCVQVVELCV